MRSARNSQSSWIAKTWVKGHSPIRTKIPPTPYPSPRGGGENHLSEAKMLGWGEWGKTEFTLAQTK